MRIDYQRNEQHKMKPNYLFPKLSVQLTKPQLVRTPSSFSVYKTIRPFLVIARLLGTFPISNISSAFPSDLRYNVCSFPFIYSWILLVTYLTLGSFTTVSTWDFVRRMVKESLNVIVFNLTLIGYIVQGVLAKICMLWKAKQLPLQFVQWDTIGRELKISSFKKMWYRHMAIQGIGGFLLVTFYVGDLNVRHQQFLEQELSKMVIIVISIIAVIFFLIILIDMFTPNWIMAYYLGAACEAFERVDEQLNTLLQLYRGPNIAREVAHLRCIHEQICVLVEQLNDTMAYNIFVSFSCGTIEVCLVMYMVCVRDETTLGLHVWIITAVVMLLELLSISTAFENVDNKSSLHARTLMKAHNMELSPESRFQIQVFLSKLTGSPLKLSALGFFTVRKSIITAIIATIFNYCIILIQFNGSENNVQTRCNCTNGTNSLV